MSKPPPLVQEPIDLTKWIVSGTAALTIITRQDMASVGCVFGAVLNALLAKVLKRIWNESRPAGARLKDPGMPSSHAQSLFFFASYLAVAATTAPGPEPWQLAGGAGLLPLAYALAWQRVRAGLHTPAQVAVGGAIGSATGAAWCLRAQPALVAALERSGFGSSVVATPASLVVLCAVGLAVVGSLERGWLLGPRGGRRRVSEADE